MVCSGARVSGISSASAGALYWGQFILSTHDRGRGERGEASGFDEVGQYDLRRECGRQQFPQLDQ